jgi:hypothetical protein
VINVITFFVAVNSGLNHNFGITVRVHHHFYIIMALVTIVGFPCCGKSTRAKQIKEYLEKRIAEETGGPKLSVVLVDDDNSHVPRSTYDSMSPHLYLFHQEAETGLG